MNTPDSDRLEQLSRRLAAFARARDWEKFHSPKNLSMALIAEAAELVEHFQWLTQTESAALPADTREAVRLELADILIYLVRLGERLDIDLIRAAHDKMDLNEERFPVEKVRGLARRASEYD